MRMPELVKRPNEKFPIGLKYLSPDLEDGATIASVAVSITPTETNGLEVVGSPVIDNDKVSQMVQKGIDGHEYYVTFLTITSVGHIYEDKLLVEIRN